MDKIIIDTDPGVDDSMAIQLALGSEKFDILGLTTVFGNVDIDQTTTNALRLLDLAGKYHIPVAKGAKKPSKGNFSGGVPFVHGDDGQGNTFQPPSPMKALGITADEFIINQVFQFPNQVKIVALGPLTNLASTIRKRPEITKLIKEIVFMGGNAFCPGNATPAAEANMFSDPDAADFVLGSNCPITMVGLDVTHKTILTTKILDEISKFDSPINNHVTKSYQFYQDFFKRVNKIDGTFVHDSSAIAYLINSDLFSTQEYSIRVETRDCISKGKTWPSLGQSDHEDTPALEPWASRPKIKICTEVDSSGVLELMKTHLMR